MEGGYFSFSFPYSLSLFRQLGRTEKLKRAEVRGESERGEEESRVISSPRFPRRQIARIVSRDRI